MPGGEGSPDFGLVQTQARVGRGGALPGWPPKAEAAPRLHSATWAGGATGFRSLLRENPGEEAEASSG